MNKQFYRKDEYVVREGDDANCLFIIKTGEFSCEKDGQNIRLLGKGEFFGEKSILTKSKRSLDVKATKESSCLTVSNATLNSLLGNNFRSLLLNRLVEDSLKKYEFFKEVNRELIDVIADFIVVEDFKKNQICIEKDTYLEKMLYTVIVGNLIEPNSGTVVMSKADVMYRGRVLNKIIPFNRLAAEPDCLLASIDLAKVEAAFSTKFLDLIKHYSFSSVIKTISIFSNLGETKLKKIAQISRYCKFSKGEKILIEGEIGRRFFFIKKGVIDFYIKDKFIRSISDRGFFGERALFYDEKRTATAVSKVESELYTIEKDDFEDLFDERQKTHFLNRLMLHDNKVELDDLVSYGEIGKGSYSTVYIVKSIKNNFFYALKQVRKSAVIVDNLFDNLLMEKKVLLQVDHPFITKLVKTLKDKRAVYFLEELVEGKELFDVLREIGLLDHDLTRFYAATMFAAVDYLHSHNIIYRDIKPENIMVLANGYIKLIDFGTVKMIDGRTATVIGTPHYTAPEVILGEGYSFSVDYWSIGICMFEFICGALPYGEHSNSPNEIYMEIIKNKVVYPSMCTNAVFKHIVNTLLSKNPLERLFKLFQVKQHIYFQNFDWDALANLEMESEYLPKIKSFKKSKGYPFVEEQSKKMEEEEVFYSSEEIEAYRNWEETF